MFHCSSCIGDIAALKVAVQEITGNNIVYSASLLPMSFIPCICKVTITELFLLHDCLV